jgi:nicotinamide phosphoribosyltransferase
VATLSLNARKIIETALIQSADDPASEIPFKLHDFGARGVSSRESAMLGGMAHLVNFQGTDTVAALVAAREFYGCPMAGYSIPAAEHSTMTSWGRNRETEAYQSMLDHFAKPGSIIAVVSDSYDIDHAIAHIWGQKLKSKVIESGATIVIRVDSGDPVEQVLGALNKLDHAFGHRLNSKGFKLLNHVRVIQGDGIDLNTIQEILDTVLNAGYSASNVVFGMGGALLQKVNRDTQKFAYKVCEATIDGKRIPIRKEPVSDKGKWSKAGRQDLIRNTNGEFQTITIPDSLNQSPDSVLQTVYVDGKLQNEATFDEIRKRASCHS